MEPPGGQLDCLARIAGRFLARYARPAFWIRFRSLLLLLIAVFLADSGACELLAAFEPVGFFGVPFPFGALFKVLGISLVSHRSHITLTIIFVRNVKSENYEINLNTHQMLLLPLSNKQ